MRKALLVLTPLLLAGCVNDAETYYISGNEHSITVRAEQSWFWDEDVTLYATVARQPECQRRFALATLLKKNVQLELYATGENVFTLKTPQEAWTFDTQGCAEVETEDSEGELVGTFRLDGSKMVFDQAEAVPEDEAKGTAGAAP